MTDIDDWPEVAQLGGTGRAPSPPDDTPAGQSAALPAPEAAEVGRPSPLVSGAGVEHGQPPARPGVLVCRDRDCRAEIRMALTEDRVKPMPVDADPHPDGNLVWRKIAGEWRMHVLRKTEHADPGERRFRSHFETCTSPDAFRKRAKRERDATEQAAVATLDLVGLSPEPVAEKPRGHRVVQLPTPPPTGDVVDLVTRDPAPTLAELGARQPEAERTCSGCGVVAAAVMRTLWGAAPVLLEREAGMYELLAVKAGTQWRVRPVADGEQGLPFWNRRAAHQCTTYTRTCQTPGHEKIPGSLTAGGVYCRDCLASRESSRTR